MDIGTTLAQYRITAKLGEGGMGQVYRAEDTRLKRDVALKVLPADVAGDPDRLARLEREALVLARLDHPNIAAIYGFGEAVPQAPGAAAQTSGASTPTSGEAAQTSGASTPTPGEAAQTPVRFLVMQLAEGETLDALLDRRGEVTGSTPSRSAAPTAQGPDAAARPDAAPERRRGLALDEALVIAAAIADALQAAHREGIIHRDLKAANIMVAFDHGEPRVKVLDFGLAKVSQPGVLGGGADGPGSGTMLAATQAGLIMGTAGYMSPEQARGLPVDPRTDVWAFGVLLYEVLTGNRLFQGDTVSDTLAAVLRDEVDLRELPADTPLPVRRLLRRCLERDARRRLRDMGDAALEIADARAGLLGADAEDIAVLLPRAGVPGDPETGSRAAGWMLVVAALALLGLGAVLALAFLPRGASDAMPVRVIGDLGPKDARSAVISPDGRRLALHIGDELWVREFDDLQGRLLEGSDDHRGHPFWAPDSSRLAYFASDELLVASVVDGSARRVDIGRRATSSAGTWAPAGIIVAGSARGIGELLLVPPDGGSASVIARSPAPGLLRNPAMLPDGRTLVYELAERGDGVFSYGTVMLQRGLEPDSPVETIVDGDDNFAGFAYVEELGLLLLESQYTGVWALPLSRDGFVVTGTLERVLPHAEDMSVSRDGTLLFRALENRLETQPFRWMHRNGTVMETVESDMLEPRSVTLSPDATRVAFTGPREPGLAHDIWVLDLQRGARTRITAEPGAGDMPAWRGNEQLVFIGRNQRGAPGALLSQPASGAGRPEAIATGGFFRNPAGSADGRYVVFEALTTGGEMAPPSPAEGRRGGAGDPGTRQASGPRSVWNVHYIDGDGMPLLYRASDDNETKPTLSPDGSRIAYISDAAGSNEVWVDTFPQPSEPVRISVSGGGNVRWSPAGDEIIYDDGAETLWSVALAPGAAHARAAYAAPERLFVQGAAATRFGAFNPRSWDVGAGGELILTVQRYAEGISYVNVIENFPRWYRERR